MPGQLETIRQETPVKRVETVIIGAGQAGLSVGYHLARRDRSFVILDGHERVGDNWRRHWNSLRLYTPARYDGLPGMPFPAPAWTFPGKDEVADYLESYASRFDLPVETGVHVDEISQDGSGYVLDCGDRRLAADNVVVATGTFGRPYTPSFAGELDPRITQLHSSRYRNPDQLQSGPVLVVGAAHSGSDIAYELATAGHKTVLCGRDTGQAPFQIESRRAQLMFPVWSFLAKRVLTIRTPMGRKVRSKIRAHGAPLLRRRSGDLEAAGVVRTEARAARAEDGKPVLEDGSSLDVSNVVWCTGFKPDLDWIQVELGQNDGWPAERRGVVEKAPGLYFAGLAFQYSFSSMLLLGVGRDAKHLADRIAA